MPALNFQKRFVPLIESGEKRQTIRDLRKNPIKARDLLYLYTGMRTKNCTIIKTPFAYMMGLEQWIKYSKKQWEKITSSRNLVICVSAQPIFITEQGFNIWDNSQKKPYLLGKIKRGEIISINFAKADGFNTEDEFYEYFKEEKERVLIKW